MTARLYRSANNPVLVMESVVSKNSEFTYRVQRVSVSLSELVSGFDMSETERFDRRIFIQIVAEACHE